LWEWDVIISSNPKEIKFENLIVDWVGLTPEEVKHSVIDIALDITMYINHGGGRTIKFYFQFGFLSPSPLPF